MSVIFVVATLEGCVACHNFMSQEYQKLYYIIKQNPNIKLINVNVSYDEGLLNMVFDGEINPKFNKLLKFFPSFYLFTKKSWNNHNEPLMGVAMGMDLISLDENIDEYEPVTSNIWNWIKTSLSKPPFKYSYNLTNDYIRGLGVKKY